MYFLNFFKILSCTLTIQVRGLIFIFFTFLKTRHSVGLRTYIAPPYLNSIGQNHGGGGCLLGKNSQAGLGLKQPQP